jgi:hypothetical protein
LDWGYPAGRRFGLGFNQLTQDSKPPVIQAAASTLVHAGGAILRSNRVDVMGT